MNLTMYKNNPVVNYRILMVENSVEDALLMACSFREEGFQIQFERVETSTAMISALETQQWDLIVSKNDILQLDGFKVASILKDMRKNIPLIIVADSIDLSHKEELLNAGVCDVVTNKGISEMVQILQNNQPMTKQVPAEIASMESKNNKITNEDLLKAKILIVDDDPKNVAVIQQVLEMAGYENIHFTSDPREVCDLYQEIWPDLLLLDLNMPYFNGFQVMEQLKKVEQRDYIPILILTAQTDRESRLKALKGGAKDFLLKPFDLVEVIHRIQNMLEVRLLHNKLRTQNYGLEEKVVERTKELYKTQLSVVQHLGRAAEYRDNETGNHVIRMSRSASLMAKEMGFDQNYCDLILNAAPMHDIGKIGIPDGILLKPGKHDVEEWGVMRTHAEIGYKILSDDPSELMQLAAKIAFQHHEKWDGSGYPNGLKGTEISIEARITTVCDVFDALTSERPYKRPWPIEKAVKYIEDQKGVSFDPEVVEIFLKVLPEITRIMDQYTDS